MSTIRKVSLEYRQARDLARRQRAEAAYLENMRRFGEALRLGMIKPPPAPTLPLTARLVQPRFELKVRLGKGSFEAGEEKLIYRGHRTGEVDGRGYELVTYARPPERNKYAGYFSPGSWK